MNVTGTERQRAVIAAFRMKPEASQGEIARSAGVTQTYVSIILQDYLDSKARDHSCRVPVSTTPRQVERELHPSPWIGDLVEIAAPLPAQRRSRRPGLHWPS